MFEYPSVSIVTVNLNGKEHLRECFSSIQKLNYPKDKIEVIMIDNGSIDGSVDFVQNKFSWVKVITNAKNEGFAKPSNDGARAAKGEYVAFINNDMRVQPNWLAELIKSIKNNNAQCAGSVILNWDGKLLDFAGGAATYYGMGFQYDFHKPLAQVQDKLLSDRELLFACGGAMLVDRKIFLNCGGFDEDFFAYFEDLDLGWRLNVLGYKVVLSVKSRVFHKHHSTASGFKKSDMDFIYGRNNLYMIYKNFGDEMLRSTFLPAVLMNFQFIYDRTELNKDDFDLRIKNTGKRNSKFAISEMAGARICSLQDFIDNLDIMTEKRRWVQSNRKVDDKDLVKFFDDPLLPVGNDIISYGKIKYSFAKNFDIAEAFGKKLRQKVLIVSSDKIGVKMAGSAIRYYEFAKSLSKYCDVTLASFGNSELTEPDFKIVSYTMEDPQEIEICAAEADIILVQGYVTETCQNFFNIAKNHNLIVDLYDPYVIEHLEIFKNHDIALRRRDNKTAESILKKQLETGDYFICANDKQRSYWIGMLSAAGKITPDTYDLGRNMGNYIGIVPYGIPDEEPVHTKNVIKGVIPGINEDDKVLIWGGGVWNWFDPLTLIKAMKIISEKRQDVKLFFMGVKHPNPSIPTMKMLTDAVDLARELNLIDKYVFFNFDWVDYNERQNYLMEADIGVSCHFDTLETQMSFRTRILDYLWTDLPIVCTKGDYFGDLLEARNIGLSVDYQDENQFAEKILKLIEDKQMYAACKENIKQVAEQLKWKNVTKPLVEYCKNPVRHKSISHYGMPSEILSVLERNGSETRKFKSGSVLEKLDRIEKYQLELGNRIKEISDNSEDTRDTVFDLQDWSYMMNERFNKAKRLANPFNFIKAIFRRIFRR